VFRNNIPVRLLLFAKKSLKLTLKFWNLENLIEIDRAFLMGSARATPSFPPRSWVRLYNLL
jgi:hypothetical protein